MVTSLRHAVPASLAAGMAKDPSFETLIRDAARLVAARAPEAEPAVTRLKAARPGHPAGHALMARLHHHAGRYDQMLAEAHAAIACAPGDADLTRLLIEALIFAGDHATAYATARQAASRAWNDPAELQRLAEIFAHDGRHRDACEANTRAAALLQERSGRADPRALYNLASARIALGEIKAARAELDLVIALNPADGDAWYNRATLTRATPAENHVAALRARLADPLRHAADEVSLAYALGKELEDLGNHAGAWEAIMRGAKARRRLLSYGANADAAMMDAIARTFDAAWFKRNGPSGKGQSGDGPTPIFVLGLPRSGTTLIDRILGSLEGVASLGEINDFALALTLTAGGATGKEDLLSRASAMDVMKLGNDYRHRIASFGATGRYLIDKTPLNFLYIGLIAASLPDARIVHVQRGAMDNAWAMLKTLFRMGYPFSYSLDDLAIYMTAKAQLMAHWRNALGQRLIEVSYEAMVSNLDGESRRLAQACGLEWHEAALSFHASTAPVATASAAQVRRPINRESVGLWRHHKAGLAPLAEAFDRAGIPLEADEA